MLTPIVTIQGREVGPGHPVFISAEVGLNHNGSMELAKQLIDAAAHAGADAVKFQNYRTEDFVADKAATYTYFSLIGREITETQWEMFKRCELTVEQIYELKLYCDAQSIIFHSTPTSPEGVKDLVTMGSAAVKIASDMTNFEMIAEAARSKLPTIMSTGLDHFMSIEEKLQHFQYWGGSQVVLLHCVREYPAEHAYLDRIKIMAKNFPGVPIGYSDHTVGPWAAATAVRHYGACWVEKHFTLDHCLPGPDHGWSSDPSEFSEMVRMIRDADNSKLHTPPRCLHRCRATL